jgi:hypothetical protein
MNAPFPKLPGIGFRILISCRKRRIDRADPIASCFLAITNNEPVAPETSLLLL